ncbi:MAG: mechanosensitive ion channel family protein [Coriobacteriales bacterium]|nr:mechanosensitive ion channel family protein [Coriobacteriales bacterium]
MEESIDQTAQVVTTWPWFMQIVLAAVIVALTLLITRAVTKLLRRVLHSDSNPLPASSIFINLTRIAIWVIAIGILLKVCFNYDATGIVAGLGVAGIALSLGLQDTISNLIGGLQISLSRTVMPGDHVRYEGKLGEVKDVNWRYTRVQTQGSSTFIIPNSKMNSNSIESIDDIHSVTIPITIPLPLCTQEFLDRIVAAVLDRMGDALSADNPPTVLLSGTSSFDGTYIDAQVIIFAGWERSDGVLIDQALRAITPLLQETDRQHRAQLEAAPEGLF